MRRCLLGVVLLGALSACGGSEEPNLLNISQPRAEGPDEFAAALGGNAAVLSRASNDGALLAHTRRFGVDPNIRSDLAAADLEFRRANDGRLLERLFNVNVYFRAYEEMSLDQYRELERLRRSGVRTSAVPPNPATDE